MPRDLNDWSKEDLIAEIEKIKACKKYGLVWEDKPEEVVELCKENIPIVTEVKKNKLVSGFGPENILIEGDNYHALSVLNYTHKGKIDLIYIDPPYNTGASDWKYNNDYVDKDDSYRHSKWLSMMRHRLNISKELLSNHGFLICAIDHNELFTLGVLLDTIFQEENRIGIISVVHKPEGRNQEKFFGTSNEFMLVYAKNINNANFNKVILADELKDRFNEEDERGKFRLKNFIRLTDGKYSLRENKPHFFYPVYVSNDLTKFSLEKKSGFIEVFPITDKGIERTWKTTKETFIKLANTDNIIAKKESNNIYLYEKLREDQVIKTHWIKKEYHAYHFGTKLLESILGSKKFDFPKSFHLIFDVLKLTTRPDAVILDFFAGSGTTGHAALELNKQDGGNRKFILCTNNENNICKEVTYERLKRVITGYISKNKKVEGLGSNLSYFKTDLVNIEKLSKISDEAKIKVSHKAGEMIAIRENTLHEIESNDHWQIFETQDKSKRSVVYFQEDKSQIKALVERIHKDKVPTKLYVFSWGKNDSTYDYSDELISVDDIPEPILAVYKEINRI